jgi:hypothetical protein
MRDRKNPGKMQATGREACSVKKRVFVTGRVDYLGSNRCAPRPKQDGEVIYIHDYSAGTPQARL